MAVGIFEMKRLLLFPIMITVIISAGPSYSSGVFESEQLTKSASKCAALYYVLASDRKREPQYTKLVIKLGGLMRAILSTHMKVLLKRTIKNGDLSDAVNPRAQLLGQQYDRDPSDVAMVYDECDAWRAKIAIYFQSDEVKNAGRNKASQHSVLLNVPLAPTSRDVKNAGDGVSLQLVRSAFEEWTGRGRITSDSVRDLLK